jgi:hypothetical protein
MAAQPQISATNLSLALRGCLIVQAFSAFETRHELSFSQPRNRISSSALFVIKGLYVDRAN